MNTHTPGPLTIRDDTIILDRHDNEVARVTRYGAGIVPAGYRCPWHSAPENAALLAVSYMLLDRTARELGVEAMELATLDLAALIRAARDVKAEHGRTEPGDEPTPLDEAIYRLAHLIP